MLHYMSKAEFVTLVRLSEKKSLIKARRRFSA